jgi:hypothetical protein
MSFILKISYKKIIFIDFIYLSNKIYKESFVFNFF